jgi:hypothetical protein
VTGTIDELHGPVYGHYLKAVHPLNGDLTLRDWIGSDMQMLMRFPFGNVLTSPIIHATVIGDGWSYDVF